MDSFGKKVTVSGFNEVEGSLNFRDLGYGCHAPVSQCPIRLGFIYRSGSTEEITVSGWDYMINTLRIRTIIDLRLSTEKKSSCLNQRNMLHGKNIRVVEAPLVKSQSALHDRFAIYRDGTSLGVKEISDSYIDILGSSTAEIKRIVEVILDESGTPVLIHCSLGRDRTGIVCAILLFVAGATDEFIAREYEESGIALSLSKEVISRAVSSLLPNAEDLDNAIDNMIKVEKEAMKITLLTIKSRFGDINWYLKFHCGVSDHDLQKLRGILRKPVAN